jgi:Lipocalin-like domain
LSVFWSACGRIWRPFSVSVPERSPGRAPSGGCEFRIGVGAEARNASTTLGLGVLAHAGVVCGCPLARWSEKIGGSVREKFVGAWRLVSIETIRPNGGVIYPFYGMYPEGLIVYDRDGWMSVRPTPHRAEGRLMGSISSCAIGGESRCRRGLLLTSAHGPLTHRTRQSRTISNSRCGRENEVKRESGILFWMAIAWL